MFGKKKIPAKEPSSASAWFGTQPLADGEQEAVDAIFPGLREWEEQPWQADETSHRWPRKRS